ncbi:MAG: CMP deaminase [Hyphomicrobiaceae bacterium]|nr:MAG: CMP deaminase [Hyphomicrobiaceae bacterium]
MSHKWDERFMGLARNVAAWSKDPSTKVGSIIVRPDRTVASQGYNGFPRGVLDLPALLHDRPARLLRTVHAEANAIVAAAEKLHGCTLYVWPFPPCATCAGLIIQAGISRVVTCEPEATLAERWEASLEASKTLFREAGVAFEMLGRSA